MRKIVLFAVILILGISLKINAQDVIQLKSGEVIQALVQEITPDLIKYKKFENPDGPLYSVPKQQVVMITYKNGSKDVFSEMPVTTKNEPVTFEQKQKLRLLTANKGVVKENGITLSKTEVRIIMSDNGQALKLYKSGSSLLSVGGATGIAGLGVVIVAALVEKSGKFEDNSAAMVGIVGGVACLATSMITTFAGRAKIKDAVNIYNFDTKNQTSYKVDLGISEYGLALRFTF